MSLGDLFQEQQSNWERDPSTTSQRSEELNDEVKLNACDAGDSITYHFNDDATDIHLENKAIVEKLSCLQPLKEMKAILDKSKDAISGIDAHELCGLRAKLTNSMKHTIDPLSTNKTDWKESTYALLKEFDMGASTDMGGHGGTSMMTLKRDSENDLFLFLKPKDVTEARNYQIISQTEPDLMKFMPRVFGEVRVDGKDYLIMENVRVSEGGKPTPQLLDIKLAGKLEDPSLPDQFKDKKFNPIANQKEMVKTRNEKKSRFKLFTMKTNVNQSPNYMVTTEHFRFFNYGDSEKNLRKSLNGVSPEHLFKLENDLKILQQTIKSSSIAFIGASVIFTKQLDGSIKPLLIDPAHMQVDARRQDHVDLILNETAEQSRVYYSDDNKELEFKKQKISNVIAISSIMQSIQRCRTDATSRSNLMSMHEMNTERQLETSVSHLDPNPNLSKRVFSLINS